MSDGKNTKLYFHIFTNDMESNIEVFKTDLVIGEV